MFEINEFDYVNRGRYVFELFSDDYKRLINQTGVRTKMAPLNGGEETNVCWDGIVAPDGMFYFPISSETGVGMGSKLAKFDYENHKVDVCFAGDDVFLPNDRKMPHTKFHTSLNVIPRNAIYPEAPYDPDDFLIVGASHFSDRAKHHTEWLPIGHHNHVWEGYPGGQIIVYDPKNGHAFSLGTPVPQESIYGAVYEPKHNRLYMIGFFRGHIYCYDFNERRTIKDLGKAAETCCYRLVLGADGNIYGCSKSGQLFKVNTETVELENLDWHVPDFKENRVSYSWYRYMVQGRNHPSGKYLYFCIDSIPWMYKLEFATGKVSCLGRALPLDGLYEPHVQNADTSIRAFDFDKDGVMWLVVMPPGESPTHYFAPGSYLIRWDPDNGEAPYCCGLLGGPDRIHHWVTELAYDPKNDRLFWVDQCSGTNIRPSAGGVDLKEFRKVYRERGPVSDDAMHMGRKLSEAELKRRNEAKKKPNAGEENSGSNPFQAFPPSKVEPIRIWRKLPRLEVADSKVIGMAFESTKDSRYKLHVVSGASGCFDTAAFVLQIVDKEVVSLQRMDEIDEQYKAWLRENILPQACEFDESIKLPEVTGRRYRAKASCVVDWKDGKKFVGTLDAILSIVSADGSVYCLGNAAAYGPIRAMVTNKAKTHLWGVAGDDEDLGYVFEYDEVNGLRQLGVISYNIPDYFDGPSSSHVLSSICLSPDEKYLAIGSADRIAEVHVMDIG